MGGAASIAAQMSQLGDRGIGFRSLQKAIDTTPGGRVVFHALMDAGCRLLEPR